MSRRRTHLVVLSGYLALALFGTLPLALSFTTAIPGDGFDGLQNYWNLWWVRRALLELQTTPFFTREIFFPTGASLIFHTLNVFNGLWTLPLQLLTGIAVSYNSVVLLTFVLSGYGAYLLAMDALARTGRPLRYLDAAAFVAGFVFAFAPVRFAHLLGHMQVLSSEWLPFFCLAFLQMERQRGPLLRRAVRPAFFLALNALCDWYFVLYLLLFAGLLAVCRWFQLVWKHRRPETHALRAWLAPPANALAVTALFALMLSPLLAPMLNEAAGADYLRPPFDETLTLSADLVAFVTPSEFQPWWGGAGRAIAEQFTSSSSERTVFAGYTALALAALAVWRCGRRAAFWLFILTAYFLLALGPYLHVLGTIVAPLPLPYLWLYSVLPLVRIARSVSRFDLMVMLALGNLAALGLLALSLRPRLATLGAVLIAVEFLAAPFPLSPIAVPSFYSQLASEPGEFSVLELPINWDRPDPLLYQTVHAHPLITAYTSRANPLSIVEKTPVLSLLRSLAPDIVQYDIRAVGPSVLADLGVRYVINHPLTMGAGDERTLTNKVLQQLFGGARPLVNEPNLVVYRVTTPDQHVPYITLGDGWGALELQAGAPQRSIEHAAQLQFPGPVALSPTVMLTASASAGAHLYISSDSGGSGRRGAAVVVGPNWTTFALKLPPLSEVWLTTDAPIAVRSLEITPPE